MDILLASLPYFGLGFIVAVLARFTGVAMSFLLVPTLLYWGATPLEVVAFMLTFVVYNNFTLETQDMRLEMKNLAFFRGWRIALPLVVALILAFVAPPLSVAFFIICFIMELGANVYRKIEPRHRPTMGQLGLITIISLLWCVVGVAILPWIPANYFYGVVGLVMLVITAFTWYAGKNRDAFRTSWAQVWGFMTIFLGAFGLEFSTYIKGLRRNRGTSFDTLLPLVTVIAALGGALMVFAMYNMFSMPSLIAAVGAALGTRAFGVYEYSKQGTFSYAAMAMAILAAVCLLLVAPVPTGLDLIEGLI
ncbi:MAG: hypothetical protein KHZ77_08535 [Veillonella sp.]|uniref:hypothetical protein n=1 Tax=Veillonella sp. TaxID=1926307 RepID=UPI0025FFB1B9|nr:hypothetical protein [Veillonella sp.]MBS4914180.1 hypothetical protein [Veillonella sp.]